MIARITFAQDVRAGREASAAHVWEQGFEDAWAQA